MATKRSGLGRNLSALLGQNAAVTPDTNNTKPSLSLAVDLLQPGKYQPRGEIEEQPLTELAESIKQQGVLQPLLVRPISENRYEIIAGERRWRASQLAGLTEVPVVVKDVDDETAMAMALIENLQREDLNAMDQARAMQRLTTEFGLTHQQVADILSKSRTTVTNFLRLLNLSLDVRKMLEHGDLEMGHARCLLMLEEASQSQVAKVIVAKNLSVRETEKLVARVKSGHEERPEKPELSPELSTYIARLNSTFKTKVQIKPSKSGKGSLVIHYKSEQDLKRLMDEIFV